MDRLAGIYPDKKTLMKTTGYMVVLGTLMILGIVAALAGCTSSNTATATPSAISPADIQPIAGPIAENILQSLNRNNYAGFSRDFNSTMKDTLDKPTFDKLYSQMQTAVGDYQSLDFVNAADQNGSLSILYVAQFSREPAGVSINLVLQGVNGGYKVRGLNFDSPNLHGKPLDVGELKAYADPETENILSSLDNNDYTGFSRDLDQDMKNALPQARFDKLYNLLKSAAGDYQSQKFESASLQNNFITVRYLARYTGEPAGVWVTISFDSNRKVAGLYFNSPKLQKAQSN